MGRTAVVGANSSDTLTNKGVICSMIIKTYQHGKKRRGERERKTSHQPHWLENKNMYVCHFQIIMRALLDPHYTFIVSSTKSISIVNVLFGYE